MIRKSSESLAFSHYLRFIDLVLCGTADEAKSANPTAEAEFGGLHRRRFLPYNASDAYRLLKVATEAFVVVNGGVMPTVNGLYNINFTTGDNQALRDRVELEDPNVDLESLWRSGDPHHYLRSIGANGLSSDTLRTILYLKLIREKFPDVRLKSAAFADEEETKLPEACYGILQASFTNPCLLELILVLLARGGDAGPVHERDRPAVPEHPGAPRRGPAGDAGDRPAAALE